MNVKLIFFITATFFAYSYACGCYGPSSCNVAGQLDRCTATAVCDCCPVCNSCPQLLSGCASTAQNSGLQFHPSIPSTFQINQPIGQFKINSTSQPSFYLFGTPCVNPPLPSGLNFGFASDNITMVLEGTPSQIVPPTTYKVIVRGSVEQIFYTSITFSIIDTQTPDCPNSTTGSSQPSTCTVGEMKCIGASSYQTCANGANGSPAYGVTQNCASGSSCHQSGSYIYCY